jgi:exopolysaccharide biosynthesis polyprenyl glycosylphosphotransferase
MDSTGIPLPESIDIPRPKSVEVPNVLDRLVGTRRRDRDYGLRRALVAGDWIALVLATIGAFVITGNRPMPAREALWIVATLPFWALLFRGYGLYERPLRRIEPTQLDDASSLIHALLIGTLGMWLFFRIGPVDRMNLEEVILFGVLALPLIAFFRVLVRGVNLRIRGPERVLVVAPMNEVRVIQRKLHHHPAYAMEVVAALPFGGDEPGALGVQVCDSFAELPAMVFSGGIDHVLVQLNPDLMSQEETATLMRSCGRAGVRFGTFARERALLTPAVDLNHLEGMGFLSYHPPVLSRTSQWLKRTMDVAVASIALLVAAVPLLLIALAIKLDDPESPVLFRQRRVGKDGERFWLLKFRTMVPDADDMVAQLMEQSLDPDWLVMEEDPRVTRIGRFLRRSSLDELPQLWNVLRGEMSLVGPRPLSERDDAEVRGWGRHRLDCIPGVTGYWQVLGRNNIPFSEMIEIDYAYATSWTLWGDIKLLIRTIPVVLLRRGSN